MKVIDDQTPVAWTSVPHEALVLASDGSEIGVAEKLLGDVGEDIFHGVVVRRRPNGGLVELPAARITKMTRQSIMTDLDAADAASLPPYR